jgi:hypothetical protein
MARDNILLTYITVDLLFVISGGLLIIFALMTEGEAKSVPTLDTVARDLLLFRCPLNGQSPPKVQLSDRMNADEKTAAIGNAVMIFVTFLISVPAMVMPMTRGWLKFHGYMTVVCAIFTMVIGLDIWFDTLKTRKNLALVWTQQPASSQSLIQQKVCCFTAMVILEEIILICNSSTAAATPTAPPHHLSKTAHARTHWLLLLVWVAWVRSQHTPTTSWIWSSPAHLEL